MSRRSILLVAACSAVAGVAILLGPCTTISARVDPSEDATRGILWRAELGKGHSAVAVSGDRIVSMGSTVTADGRETLDVVWCLDAKTGEVMWRFTYPCPEIYFAGPRSTPVISGGRVFTVSWDGQVHCLDLDDGSMAWRLDLAAEKLGLPGHWGMAASPVVVGGVVVLSAGSGGVALRAATGELVWRSESGETSLASPLVLPGRAGQLLVPSVGVLRSVDAATGEELWTLPWDRDYHLGPLSMDDTLVVLANTGATLVDIGTGRPEVRRSIDLRLSNFQGCAVVDGHLYAFSGMDLVCFDLRAGRERWRERVGRNGALTAADGRLFVLAGNGELRVIDASPERMVEVLRMAVFDLGDNRGVPQPDQHHCWTAPVVADGRIYLRSNHGRLACVSLSMLGKA